MNKSKILRNNLKFFFILFLFLFLFLNLYFLYGDNDCYSLSKEQRCVCFEISEKKNENIYSKKEISLNCTTIE